jgi:CheY-like chemotaxis protein/anti-sigma regulatory factor (Ser/Thr protein kinase)
VRITQVIANLLTNAARYTPAGGAIRLECARQSRRAVVRVVDNGYGMTPELIDRVFDIFVQGRAGEENSGLGIGLSLVKQLVDLHGGSVTAESAGPGQGSAFTVMLPLLNEERAQDAELRESAVLLHEPIRQAPRGLRVLLIEDNQDIRDLTYTMLERGGHHVEPAENGERALQLAAQQRFDIVLVDIGLPDIGGVDLGRMLRPLVGGARMVAVTGYGHAEVRNEASAAGFDAYLIKPAEQAELDMQLALAADVGGMNALESLPA